MRSVRSLSANDQLSQVKKQISKTLDELEDTKCFELPRSLSMERLSLKKLSLPSESVATVLNSSKSMTEISQHIKHPSNPNSIFTPDPFSTTSCASQTMDPLSMNEKKDSKEFSTQTIGQDQNMQAYHLPNILIQKDQESQTRNKDAAYINTVDDSDNLNDMKEEIKRLQNEIMMLSQPKASDSPLKNPDLETVKSKLRKAEMEIKSLVEQNRIISAENQKLIVNAAHKKENVTREREILYEFIHDFVVNNTINDNPVAKALVEQMSTNLYSLIEHSHDVSQLNRMKNLFLSFRESVVQIVSESIQLDQRISNLADSSNAIRIESETIISQLEEKSNALMKENQELQQKMQDIISQRVSDVVINPTKLISKHEISTSTETLRQEKYDVPNHDQEMIKSLKSENESLKMKLSAFEKEAPTYPLSDLYEKIVALINRDASSGINIKEILEWVEEKRLVIEELEKIKTQYSNLSFKHKHLIKEYSDQKSIMDEIQKRITDKESEWQTKFKEFASNANQLEARHSSLESILCEYAVQFQGVISLASESSDACTSVHPLPFLKYFGNLQKSNSSLDHSLQHASSALSESQRATNQALQNLDIKHSQIINLEREKQEISSLITKFKSEISAKDKEMSAVKSQNQQLQDRNLKLSDKLKRIADAFKWTMV